jgi:hypothetical protein
MKKGAKKVARSGKGAVRKAYDKVETKVMAAVGRKAVKVKVSEAKVVGRKAARAALTAGAMAAAGVVLREMRKPRRDDA